MMLRQGFMRLLEVENSTTAVRYLRIVPDFKNRHNKLSPDTRLAVKNALIILQFSCVY